MKLYMFRTVPMSIIRSFHCTHSKGMCHTGLLTACEQEQTLLFASSQQTSMTYTIAVCTVKNSWWWTEELSERRRVSFQNKSEKLVHLDGFIIRNKPYELVHTYTHIYSMSVYMKHPPGLLEGAGSECRKDKEHEICSLLGFYTA
jgi:hypothetical protein